MAWQSIARERGKFESLEPRQLLAGDVLVNVVHGALHVEGDAEANQVMITAGAEAGAYVVTGLSGTTLEGATDPITVTDVRSIHIDLDAGADLAAIVGADVRGKVSVNTGEDDDRVLIGTAEGATELDGVLPADLDLSVSIRGSLKIDTNGGSDVVNVDDSVAKSVSVDSGDGDDVVSLGSTAAAGDLEARLEVRQGLRVNLGEGNDELHANQVGSRKGLFASGGDGDDSFDVSDVTGKALTMLGGDGVDTATFVDLDVKLLGIHMGDDNDRVEVRDSVFTALGIALGDGDDHLITANLEARFAGLAGGEGEDTIDQTVASVFDHDRVLGFELPVPIAENLSGLPHLRHGLRGLLNRSLRI
jgi:hypothetical protein